MYETRGGQSEKCRRDRWGRELCGDKRNGDNRWKGRVEELKNRDDVQESRAQGDLHGVDRGQRQMCIRNRKKIVHSDHGIAFEEVPKKMVVVGGGAIALSWSANTLEILALASRAFAFYYLLQCLVAISVSKSLPQKIAIGAIAAVLGFITIFAVPAG